jgi:hypothetical protein
MGILYKQSSRGMKDILNSGAVRDMLTAKAESVLGAAKATAPIASGAYLESLHIEQVTTDRAVVRVVADVPYATAVEADEGTLARALDSA